MMSIPSTFSQAIFQQKENYDSMKARRRVRNVAIVLGTLLILSLAFNATVIQDTDWERIGTFDEVLGSLGRFVGIDWELIPMLVTPTIETFMMATLGTLLGLVLAIPVSWLGARNLSPLPAITYPVARFAMTLSRSVHEIVWALLFVSAVGLGALPGVLAVAMRSIGFTSKMIAEAIEDMDEKPMEAMKAVGASKFQIIWYAVVPQIMPKVLGVVLFEWDINIRRAAVMGLVGAGGLGLTFHRQMVMYNYPGVTTVILAILVMVLIGEIVSYFGRRAII